MRIDEGLGGMSADLQVRTFGPDLGTLARLAGKAREILGTVAGLTDTRAEQLAGLPQIRVHRPRARRRHPTSSSPSRAPPTSSAVRRAAAPPPGLTSAAWLKPVPTECSSPPAPTPGRRSLSIWPGSPASGGCWRSLSTARLGASNARVLQNLDRAFAVGLGSEPRPWTIDEVYRVRPDRQHDRLCGARLAGLDPALGPDCRISSISGSSPSWPSNRWRAGCSAPHVSSPPGGPSALGPRPRPLRAPRCPDPRSFPGPLPR
jgi:hypothetical protein